MRTKAVIRLSTSDEPVKNACDTVLHKELEERFPGANTMVIGVYDEDDRANVLSLAMNMMDAALDRNLNYIAISLEELEA